MWLYFTLFIVGYAVAVLTWRYVLTAIYWLCMAVGVLFAWRVVQLVEPRLADSSSGYPLGALIGGVAGFIVVGVLCAGWIRQALIYFYLQRSIQRDKDAAQAGKLW